jgi:hypothetical protein
MKCLDTRWQETEKITIRRWKCECGVRGKTKEGWLSTPIKVQERKKAKPKKQTMNQQVDHLMKAFYGGRVSKKEKQVVVKHTPIKSMFEDSVEDYKEDIGDLGIDLPRNFD